MAVGFLGCRRARAGSPEKKFEVMGGRADVPQDPAMAGGAAHSTTNLTTIVPDFPRVVLTLSSLRPHFVLTAAISAIGFLP